MEIVKITVGDQIVTLTYKSFDTDIDIDSITQIQYDNLYGEIVTVSSLLNRVGLLKAEVDNEYELYKLDCEVFEAQKRREYHKSKVSLGEKKPSEQQTDDYILSLEEVILKRKRLIQFKKNCDYISALYWAVQSKDKKLSVIMKPVIPEDFAKEIQEGIINTIMINKFKQQY